MVFLNDIAVASSANILKARDAPCWCATVIGHVYYHIISGLILLYVISQSKQALQLVPSRALDRWRWPRGSQLWVREWTTRTSRTLLIVRMLKSLTVMAWLMAWQCPRGRAPFGQHQESRPGRYFIYDNYYVPYFFGGLVYPVLLSLC